MEFIKQLVETEESKNMKNIPNPFSDGEDSRLRMLKHLYINNSVSLSIQASYGHYCTPRQTLPLEYYSTMELAIFKDGEFVNVDQVTDNEEIIDDLNEYYDGTVYGYVPVELIEKLYQELSK